MAWPLHPRRAPLSAGAPLNISMLNEEEDVFDSVTWESPSAPSYDTHDHSISSRPGFIQSTAESNDDPLQPKWEGYLTVAVRDPVKELAETKDAYVSYLVTAKVRSHSETQEDTCSVRQYLD